jgi:N-acetylmuramoyl-L-alanine amidase
MLVSWRTPISLGWLLMCLLLCNCATEPTPPARVTSFPRELPSITAPVAPKSDAEIPTQQPPKVAPPKRDYHWVRWEDWTRENGLGTPRKIDRPAVQFYELETAGGKLGLTAGSSLAFWNGTECWVGFAPQAIEGHLMIHELDAEKTFLPLLRKTLSTWRPGSTIVIDPGHGGIQSGTKCILGNYHEKDLTLDWGLRLSTILAARGWKVYMTRTNDVDITLAERVALAESVKADLFLSLHFNSSFPKMDQHGIETYCLTPTGMSSHVTRGYQDDPAERLPNNDFDTDNLKLALTLHRGLIRSTDAQDRGIRRARFMGVLRGQHRPAVLIEGGYLSNPEEARLIMDSRYRQKLAEAVAASLSESAEPIATTQTLTRAPNVN